MRCIVYWVQALAQTLFFSSICFIVFSISVIFLLLPIVFLTGHCQNDLSFQPFFPLVNLILHFRFHFLLLHVCILIHVFFVFMFHLDFNYFSRFHFFIWIFIIYLLLVFFWMLATCPHFPVLVPVIRFHFFLLYSAGLCHHDGQAAAQMTGYSE